MKANAKSVIFRYLQFVRKPLAIHEFPPDIGFSQNSIAARLRELVQEGKLTRSFRDGKGFKEWSLPSV